MDEHFDTSNNKHAPKHLPLELVFFQQTKDNLDFVFLDGDHTYEHVKEDISLWLPKIRQGGLFVFHDYGGRYAGVKKAVNRKFNKEDLILPENRSRLCGWVVK